MTFNPGYGSKCATQFLDGFCSESCNFMVPLVFQMLIPIDGTTGVIYGVQLNLWWLNRFLIVFVILETESRSKIQTLKG
jgi:hypothetical protein